MESVGAANTIPLSPISARDLANNNNDELHRGDTPKQTYIDFEGKMTQLRTDKIVGGKLTRSCITFVVHALVLGIAAAVGLVMAVLTGYGNPGFSVWFGIFSFAIGGALPGPKLTKLADGFGSNSFAPT